MPGPVAVRGARCLEGLAAIAQWTVGRISASGKEREEKADRVVELTLEEQ